MGQNRALLGFSAEEQEQHQVKVIHGGCDYILNKRRMVDCLPLAQ
jgi:hypothetical protein